MFFVIIITKTILNLNFHLNMDLKLLLKNDKINSILNEKSGDGSKFTINTENTNESQLNKYSVKYDLLTNYNSLKIKSDVECEKLKNNFEQDLNKILNDNIEDNKKIIKNEIINLLNKNNDVQNIIPKKILNSIPGDTHDKKINNLFDTVNQNIKINDNNSLSIAFKEKSLDIEESELQELTGLDKEKNNKLITDIKKIKTKTKDNNLESIVDLLLKKMITNKFNDIMEDILVNFERSCADILSNDEKINNLIFSGKNANNSNNIINNNNPFSKDNTLKDSKSLAEKVVLGISIFLVSGSAISLLLNIYTQNVSNKSYFIGFIKGFLLFFIVLITACLVFGSIYSGEVTLKKHEQFINTEVTKLIGGPFGELKIKNKITPVIYCLCVSLFMYILLLINKFIPKGNPSKRKSNRNNSNRGKSNRSNSNRGKSNRSNSNRSKSSRNTSNRNNSNRGKSK